MDQDKQLPRRRDRLARWFVAGFLIVFVCTSLTVTMYPLRPSGDAVVACKLWQYYGIEIQRAMSPGNAVGPASGSSLAAAMTPLEHLLFSAVGGAGMMGIGWIFYKFTGR